MQSEIQLQDTPPPVQERAVIAVLEYIHDESLWTQWEYFENDDLFATRIREVVETHSDRLLGRTNPQLPSSLRRVFADWMINISWVRVARAVRERYGKSVVG